MATSTFEYFFKLPGELREQILTYLLVKPEGVHIDNLSCSDLMESKSPDPRADPRSWRHAVHPVVAREDLPGWPLSYFLVSQAFHREASAVYFSRHLFYLYSERRYLRVPRVPLGSGAPTLERQDRDPESGVVQEEHSRYSYLDSLRRIRRLVLSIRSIREEFIPLLQEIVLAGGLKQLHVTVRLGLVWAREWGKLWRTDPGRWLLRLLRDHELDVTRLHLLLPREPRLEGFESLCLHEGSAARGGTGMVVDSEDTVDSSW